MATPATPVTGSGARMRRVPAFLSELATSGGLTTAFRGSSSLAASPTALATSSLSAEALAYAPTIAFANLTSSPRGPELARLT